MKKTPLLLLFISWLNFHYPVVQAQQVTPSATELQKLNELLEYIGKQADSWHNKKKSQWTDAFLTQRAQIDQQHQHLIDSIYPKYGWLKPPLVSKKASRAYFDVIRRAPLAYQEKYPNAVFLAAQEGIIRPAEYYLWIDAMRTQQYKYQIFGTQGKTDELGNFYFIPIDTTLVHNRKLPVLPPGEYIYFSNPDWVTLFVHVSHSTGQPAAQVQIYNGHSLMGQTNSKGFAQMLLPRFSQPQKLLLKKGKGTKEVSLSNPHKQDWLDLFITF